jgi:hypothetical protein
MLQSVKLSFDAAVDGNFDETRCDSTAVAL